MPHNVSSVLSTLSELMSGEASNVRTTANVPCRLDLTQERAMKLHRMFALALSLLLIATACGSTAEADRTGAAPSGTDGVRTVAPNVGASLQANPPPDLVILDVRTPDEFSEAHLEGAVLVDFYDEDFADQLGALDPDVPYLVYCRSGNRSGQATALMKDLGFADVANVDGGITAWVDAGLPVVQP